MLNGKSSFSWVDGHLADLERLHRYGAIESELEMRASPADKHNCPTLRRHLSRRDVTAALHADIHARRARQFVSNQRLNLTWRPKPVLLRHTQRGMTSSRCCITCTYCPTCCTWCKFVASFRYRIDHTAARIVY